MPQGSLVVIGSGPGIGVTTAAHFASHGFDRIALLSRDSERLQSDRATVQAANTAATVKIFPVDAGDADALNKTLKQVEKDVGKPEVVFYNTARIAPSIIGTEPAESVLNDFETMALGLYVAISWAQPHLLSFSQDAKPCFLLSGGSVYREPTPQVFSLSMQKAAQRNLLASFAKLVQNKVHVANLSIAGEVKDEDPLTSKTRIAKLFWELYEEGANGRFEVEVGGDEEGKVRQP